MARRNDQTKATILNQLKKAGRPCTSLELARSVGSKRNEINPILYELEKQGVINKIPNSQPPLWQTGTGVQGISMSQTQPRGRGRGRGRGWGLWEGPGSVSSASTSTSPNYKFQTQTRSEYQFPVPGSGTGHSVQSGTTMSPRKAGSFPSQEGISTSRGYHGIFRSRIIEVLSKNTRPQTALEVAKSLGLSTRKEVNPDLYALEKQGVVSMDKSAGPPKWRLVGKTSQPVQTHRPTQSAAAQWNSPPNTSGAMGGYVHEDVSQMESEPSNDGAQDLEEMDTHLSSSSEQGDEQASQFASAALDISHIPEENIRERLLAVMQAEPSLSRTDLELSKVIGGRYSRAQVRPFLETLAAEGCISKSAGFPPKWRYVGEESVSSDMAVARSDIGLEGVGSAHVLNPVAAEFELPGTLNPPASAGLFAASVVNEMNRNPVSTLSEFCQANKLELQFVEVREYGPPHRKHFIIAACFGGENYEAESTNKKEAKRMAADLALQALKARHVLVSPNISSSSGGQSAQVPLQLNTFSDKIAHLSHEFYNQVQTSVEIAQPGRKVIAAFIMQNTESDELTVVSLGSGTRCITGDHMSLEGLVVNDSHAEVIARRSLIRFFYSQLMAVYQKSVALDQTEDTIFTKRESSNLLCIRKNLKFHLYISTAPCGDGAQFSRGDEVNKDPPTDAIHAPTMLTKAQGVLRTKMEGGEGTIPIGEGTQPQTWDGIMQGGRLRTMSCSDKVARWNILGLQGALLSHFMEPVYMASLTLGSLHHHGHLSRAVCCRFADIVDGDGGSLPLGFRVNHPSLGRVEGGDEMRRHTEKTSNFSLNWALGDQKGELNDGGNGRPVPPPGMLKSQSSTLYSRVTKICLFEQFLSLARIANRLDLLAAKSYKECKEMATDFQQTKQALYKLCERKGYGSWMRKPVEEEQFDSSVLTRLKIS